MKHIISLSTLGEDLKRIRGKVTLHTLEKKTKITASFWSQLERGEVSMSLSSLKKHAKALGYEAQIVYIGKGTIEAKRMDCIRRIKRGELDYALEDL